jgi:hypothetical protein
MTDDDAQDRSPDSYDVDAIAHDSDAQIARDSAGQASQSGDQSGQISVGAGMGGSLNYDSDSPISTTLSDTGDGVDSSRGSTGGRRPEEA